MTKRLLATCLLAWLMALTLPLAAWSSVRVPHVRTVVLVLAPYLTWDDILSGYMPTTAALASSGGIADMNVRSLLPDGGQPSVEAGALMLSAGTWARYDGMSGGAQDATGDAVVVPGIAALKRANAAEDVQIVPGALGEAIVRAGGMTAAIGNGDTRSPSSPAALVAMDTSGRVRFGDVSPRLIRYGPRTPAPLGRMSDSRHVLARLAGAVRLSQKASAPSLIVVDPGDLSRAHTALAGVPEGLERLDRVEALKQFDEILAAAAVDVPQDALLVVAAPVAAESAGTPSGWGPLILSGDGWSGELASPSTHHAGIVTNEDLAATILDALGVARPASLSGDSIFDAGGPPSPGARVADLRQIDAATRAIDAVRERVVNDFILLTATMLLLAAAVVAMRRAPALVLKTTQLGLLFVASFPAANVLMFLPLRRPLDTTAAVGLLISTAFVAWMIGVVTHHDRTLPRALAYIAMLCVVATLVDQWAGGPLSFDAFLGFSPLVGARFYGLGNEGAALLVGGAVAGMTLLFDGLRRRGWIHDARRFGFPLVALACVVTAAAPFLGANVGVAIWGTFAFGLTFASMLGRRIGLKTVLLVLLVVVLLIGAFATVDLARPGGARTHLAKSLLSAERGGIGELGTIVVRKAATNWSLLTGTNWSLLFLVMVGVLLGLRLRPVGAFKAMLAEYPDFAAGLTASLVAAVIAYFTEDSGIIVPSLLLLFPAVGVVYLMIARRIVEAGG